MAGLALDEDGRHLYVADTVGGGVVADVDTESLSVALSAELPVAAGAYASPVAVLGDEVLVGAGQEVLRLDRSTLEEVGAVSLRFDVVGILPSTRDGELFVAGPTAIERHDLDTGEVVSRVVASPAAGSFTGLGARTSSAYAGISCAC
jgi:hypothetical protein